MTQLKTILRRTILVAIVAIQVSLYPAISFAQASDQSSDNAGSSSSSQTTDPTSSTTTDPTTTPTTDGSTDTPPVDTPDSTPPPPDPTPAVTDPSTTAPTTTSTTPPITGPQSPTGPQNPTGADGQTYHYDPATGVWVNSYYTWNPVTQQYTPIAPQTSVYDPTTGTWQTTQWVYNAPTGNYVPNVVTTAHSSNLTVGVQGTGPNSTNGVSQLNNATGNFNSNTNAGILNGITQGAVTGNVLVGQNTVAGNAQSGDANDTATILNMLQSSWTPADGEFNTFSANLYGNVNGDLYLNPNLLTGPNSTLAVDQQTNDNVNVNVANNGQITNNLNLNANSGNVGVTNNTQAGNATSGNATAVGDIVNELGSSIAAGQSFIGNINIYGNLNGNILIPPDILQQLIASNGPNSTSTSSQTQNTNINANTVNNQNITNNTNLNANSGQVNLSGNTQSGNATSGNATTGITVLNLTGRQVIGSDALLVFVNVAGRWVGLIENAPAGATAAAFGDTTVNSTNNLNASLNATNNGQITNNVNIGATSGDVDATGNTKVGNATSGNATASLNLLNIDGSQLSLTNWLGILFINVFGDWNGSFGSSVPTTTNATTASVSTTTPTTVSAKVFHLVPTGNNKFILAAAVSTNSSTAASSAATTASTRAVLGTTSTKNPNPALQKPHHDWTLPAVGLLTGAVLLGIERALAFRKQRAV